MKKAHTEPFGCVDIEVGSGLDILGIPGPITKGCGWCNGNTEYGGNGMALKTGGG